MSSEYLFIYLFVFFFFFSAISKDPEVFPDPDKFDPERFINPTHPRLVDFDLPFGFGRRICPGRGFANAALFISVTSILQTMDIEPILGEDGKAYNPLDVEIDGILMYVSFLSAHKKMYTHE